MRIQILRMFTRATRLHRAPDGSLVTACTWGTTSSQGQRRLTSDSSMVNSCVPTRVTAVHVDKTLAKRRAYESQVRDLMSAGVEAAKLNYTASSEIRLLNQRRQKEVQRVMSETALDDEIKAKEQEARNRQLTHEQNRQIADLLEKERLEREKHEREIQRICETSDELKELEKKLQVAYVNKDRAAQHQERFLVAKMERERELAIEDFMEKQRQELLKAEIDKAKNRRHQSERLRGDIQKQIKEREEALREAEKEAERDKARIDAIIQKITEEDRREYEERIKRKESTRHMLQEYALQHHRDLAERKRKEKEEEERIKEYQASVARREGEVKKLKEEKKAIQDAMIAKIVAEVKRKQAEEEETRMLQELLIDEEAEANRRALDEAKKEKDLKDRLDMIRHNQEQLRLKAAQEARDRTEEERLIAMMRQKFMEDERREREEAARRRKEKERYQHLVREQQEQTRQMFEAEKDRAVADLKNAEEYETFRQKVIAEARKRLLEEHAAKLAGYLPKGTLKTEEEKKIVKQYM